MNVVIYAGATDENAHIRYVDNMKHEVVGSCNDILSLLKKPHATPYVQLYNIN